MKKVHFDTVGYYAGMFFVGIGVATLQFIPGFPFCVVIAAPLIGVGVGLIVVSHRHEEVL